jgi:hypothetical protein
MAKRSLRPLPCSTRQHHALGVDVGDLQRDNLHGPQKKRSTVTVALMVGG